MPDSDDETAPPATDKGQPKVKSNAKTTETLGEGAGFTEPNAAGEKQVLQKPSPRQEVIEAQRRELIATNMRISKVKIEVNRLREDTVRPEEVKLYSKKVSDHRATLEDLQAKIYQNCSSDAEICHYIGAFSPIEDELDRLELTLSQLDSIIESRKKQQVAEASSSAYDNVKLHKADVPTFDGKTEDWLSFKDHFEAMVIDNPKVPPLMKMGFLKSHLKGQAASIVKNKPIKASEFAPSWALVCKKYDNTREIICAYVNRIINARPVLVDNHKYLHWDDILVCMIEDKLDPETMKEWAKELPEDNVMPTLAELLEFIDRRINSLKAGSKGQKPKTQPQQGQHQPKVFNTAPATNATRPKPQSKCTVCLGDSHPLYKCEQFKSLAVPQRREFIVFKKFCEGCLSTVHQLPDCKSTSKCRVCNGDHNTLLHEYARGERRYNAVPPQPLGANFGAGGVEGGAPAHAQPEPQGAAGPNPAVHSVNTVKRLHSRPMLATAVVKVRNYLGQFIFVRVFLDAGAQACLITEKCCATLGIPRTWEDTHVYGVGDKYVATSRGTVTVTLMSRFGDYALTVDSLIMPKVTAPQPDQHIDPSRWPHLHGLPLADPRYHESSEVDMILDSGVFFTVLTGEKVEGPFGTPCALNSRFGWLIGGEVQHAATANVVHVHRVGVGETGDILKRFWELEEIPHVVTMTTDEKQAEDHFTSTTARDAEGRFVTRLPLKSDPVTLGASHDMALRRLYSLERRLNNIPQWKPEYHKFMRQYQELGHMSKVKSEDEGEVRGRTNYVPHHFVLKEESTTTKLRVVFDASAKTSNGISINSILMVGPKCQKDLFEILLRFRLHPVAIKGDITKMYRQFAVDLRDTPLLRILWRENSTEPVSTFELQTVTYGTACAPFTATRCLVKLTEDEGWEYPVASDTLRNSCYIDDVMDSFPTEDRATTAIEQLTALTSRAKLELRKWDSNSKNVLLKIPEKHRDRNGQIEPGDTVCPKALGISWDSTCDSFHFAGFTPDRSKSVSKRLVLSEMAKIFDPLGLISPWTVSLKLFFQNLWLPTVVDGVETVLDWDDDIPPSLLPIWDEYLEGIKFISELQIPRSLTPLHNRTLEIHGFCDASSKAYAAVVYMKTVDHAETTRVSLVAAKTKVAPVRQISIPRLELSGALLLARLISSVVTALNLESRIVCWTDSEIVLHWVSCHSRRFETFVANRVAVIQEIMPASAWTYVPSAMNPADCASREISADALRGHDLWWHGPPWLLRDTTPQWRKPGKSPTAAELEQKANVHMVTMVTEPFFLFEKFSTLSRLNWVVAHMFRFIFNSKNPKGKRTGAISALELKEALTVLVKRAQMESFPVEIHSLASGSQVNKGPLITLSPYLEPTSGLLRVTGRLQLSTLPFTTKHQLIVAPQHPLTKLLVEDAHLQLLHAGYKLLWSHLRRRYWILQPRNLIRKVIRACVKCQRMKAEQLTQFMGSLPKSRITPSRAFKAVGVDFAGHFNLQVIKGRGRATFKCYLCIFVCFASKAVHLEPVTDLTTAAYLACLRRFVARRGYPAEIYSDNDTNLVGGSNELKHLFFLAQLDPATKFYAEHGIKWHFNLPEAPHHGGLWEAGVKSTKYHLNRIMGPGNLTLEEFWTLLAQVEAALNSRPLCAMSEDPEDYDVLTPGHFLIGQPLMSLPDGDFSEENLSRLNRWQRVSAMFQQFWKRWSAEYLTSLQQRHKWAKKTDNVEIGDLVLMREDGASPLRWKMARVIKTHPGADGLVRGVTLKTATSEFQRPITKIAPLLRPNDDRNPQDDQA